ncbi:MAG: 50S ribosomal protein L29 [Candidatus Fermentibacter daniensis]
MKSSEMRSMTVDELTGHTRELRQEIFNLRFRKSAGQVDNPVRIRLARHELARALTVLREKELGLTGETGGK